MREPIRPPTTRPARAANLRWHALLQALSLKVSAASVPHAPTLDDAGATVERMREELAHLEHSVACHAELFEGDLMAEITAAMASIEAPASWREAVVAQLVLGLACQAEARREIEVEGPSRVRLRQLADKCEHVEGAKAALRDLRTGQMASTSDDDLATLASRWLVLALEALDEGTRGAYLTALQREIEPLWQDAC